MQCPKCQFENRDEAKFCGGCGYRFEISCPKCSAGNRVGNKFCDECGSNLKTVKEVSDQITETFRPPGSPIKETTSTDTPSIAAERKHVTVLFSDIAGYTAMSEKLDPEDVKEITSQIFGGISKIVGKYDGFIEKYAGDAVMAIFGVPKAHEDDPIRAIKAAREIHELVDGISPKVETKIGRSILMHTGVNTGLVVTGEVDTERGTHGIAGDTINVASRLSSLAEAGQIFVDEDTFRQAEGYFIFESLKPATVKGKAEPVKVHKLLSPREKPVTVRRLSGLRAELVGRKVELTELCEAVEDLKQGRGRIFSICGDAGTGKSRLIEEFKATLNLDKIQWLEGHAYAYTQSIPYFPLIDLLSRIFHIKEGDSSADIREKIESEVENLLGKNSSVVPYVGGLYSLRYPEVEEVSPEFWKSRLQDAILEILTALAKKSPTVFFLEDMHWADPSFAKLLRHAWLEIRQPAIVICVYRPTFNLFTSHQIKGIGRLYHEIKLEDLSLSDAQSMLESLLKTLSIPSDLKRYIQDKAEGNPFYLEELVNSLIECEALAQENGNWRLTKSISDADISSSIHGLISGRLDRLEKNTKRILQEASVIGRAFLYEILKKITEFKDNIDGELNILERLDLIRTRAIRPDLEYMFKHPVTQEVVYNGLLKTERKEIHEQIALIMESIFQDRLPEFYETLAFHFKQSDSVRKAVYYLMKSGEKSLRRYAVEESHNYYKEAYSILINVSEISPDNEELLIDLLNKWALVYYYRGDFKGLDELLQAHEPQAESLGDSACVGMFYGWLGLTLLVKEKSKDSYRYLSKALNFGERLNDKHVVAYACAWLTWTCAELGLLDEGVEYGKRALELCKLYDSDHYLYAKSLAGLGELYFYRGDSKKASESGKTLIEYGNRYSNIRSLVMGHVCIGQGYFIKGDLNSAIESFKDAVNISADPYYYHLPTVWLGAALIMNGQVQEAEKALMKIMDFAKYGNRDMETWAIGLLGLVFLAKGQMSKGLKMLEETNQLNIEEGKKSANATFEFILGTVFLQIIERSEPISLSFMAKNIGFLAKNIPFSAKKAEYHFNNALKISKDIGAKGFMGQTYLGLGLLHKMKKRIEQAKQCFSKAIKFSKECDAELYLKQAGEALESLQ
jgi:class 3 adenylate cyclase/tetratricopeptide (TPR) repeat protein